MRNIKIIYFVHGTTIDNEKGFATGWQQGELSELGKKQSIELREIIKDKKFDAVFSSDLKRAVDSAKIVFEKRIPLTKDKRLRECNYGDLTGKDFSKMEASLQKYVDNPFPNGESYKDVEKRIRSFLKDLLEKYTNKKVAIVAHQAPQLALEVIANGKTWQQAIEEDWRKKKQWKPGWKYVIQGNV